MTAESLEAEIKGLVARTAAVRPEQLTPDTRLLQDIGVDGDDGWELIAALGEQFGVDLSPFRPDLHFGPEGDGFVLWLRRLLRLEPSRFVPITVGDLVAAARSGRWLTPDREPV
jgi:acyl carrier protein